LACIGKPKVASQDDHSILPEHFYDRHGILRTECMLSDLLTVK
jgi:hypothetical protein